MNQLIIDYVVICDKFGKVLDFPEFVPFWKVANEIAEERVRDEFRAVEPANN